MHQSPCGGQLEVWAGSYDVNFHCDFLKLFLEVRECTSLQGCISFFPPEFYKKIMLPIAFFSSCPGSYNITKKLPKNFFFFPFL
jgi:hypothetical protein